MPNTPSHPRSTTPIPSAASSPSTSAVAMRCSGTMPANRRGVALESCERACVDGDRRESRGVEHRIDACLHHGGSCGGDHIGQVCHEDVDRRVDHVAEAFEPSIEIGRVGRRHHLHAGLEAVDPVAGRHFVDPRVDVERRAVAERDACCCCAERAVPDRCAPPNRREAARANGGRWLRPRGDRRARGRAPGEAIT